MLESEVFRLLQEDATARELLESTIPARLAYIAVDGTPRVIPVAYVFTGEAFVFGSPVRAPKVAALGENPVVALTIDDVEQPPASLLVRGVATVTIVEGAAPEYVAANLRRMPREHWAEFEREAAEMYDQMALISIRPTWAKVFDFKTRIPAAVVELMENRG
jgi:nitroimidazol reductase NimA-like FMN-containing flavoprotein (pyridoxamine 5'-phosphate oxidase superfamily)